jgi:hypothetical protein
MTVTWQRRSIVLLLKALALCHPTDEDKEKFAAEVADSVIKTGKQESTMRDVVIKLLKDFGPGKHQFCAQIILCNQLTGSRFF